MNLLIITQKVDAAGDVLGFFHSWIQEFSRHFEKVSVVCLEEGVHALPGNVSVFSLGKESHVACHMSHVLCVLRYIFRFYTYAWRLRSEYDVVFVHMNPEYVVLGGLLWRFFHKKIGLWYVHRQVNVKLRVAEKLAHVIWSTTPEAFRLKSKKVNFVGHGIDFKQFERRKGPPPSKPFRILHVGRITPIKNLDILIETARMLKEHGQEFTVHLVGSAATPSDIGYQKKLEALIKKYRLEKEINFLGKIAFSDVNREYQKSDISVNLTPTGGMDKAVLESIASGTITLSANRAFEDLFGEYAGFLLYNERDANDTARKILAIMDMEPSQKRETENYLYERARARFDLNTLIKRIADDIKTI